MPQSQKIKINGKIINRDNTYVIAEIGVNHDGRLKNVFKLIAAAARAGADAVKFQTFRAEDVVMKNVEMAEYQKNNTGNTDSQFNMIKKLELRDEWYEKIIKYCKEKKITFLSTPHGGIKSANFLEKHNVPAYKISSADITNIPLINHVAKFNKPIFLSTGMATIKEIDEALKCIRKNGNKKIIILHCTTNYPCPPEEVNLRVITTLANKFEVPIGFSDHTLGTDISPLAVSLGAVVIEKHLTLDRTMKGPDHIASIEPSTFSEMVSKIRLVKIVLGSPLKKPSLNELGIRPLVRKSIVSIKNIKKGDVFTQENIGIKRPGYGLHPREFKDILGKHAKSDIKNDQFIIKKYY